MSDSLVLQKAYAFAIKIVSLYKYLVDKKEYVLSKQMLRCGTSVGANITEANGAISDADFSAKMSIAYKEILETKYWLSLMKDAGYIEQSQFDSLYADADTIAKMLFAILKTTRIKKQFTVNS
jgi:four helix bundle protein